MSPPNCPVPPPMFPWWSLHSPQLLTPMLGTINERGSLPPPPGSVVHKSWRQFLQKKTGAEERERFDALLFPQFSPLSRLSRFSIRLLFAVLLHPLRSGRDLDPI